MGREKESSVVQGNDDRGRDKREGSGITSSAERHTGNELRRVGSSKIRPFFPREINPCYAVWNTQLDRTFRDKKTLLCLPESEPPLLAILAQP
jgi:hypothetical protein